MRLDVNHHKMKTVVLQELSLLVRIPVQIVVRYEMIVIWQLSKVAQCVSPCRPLPLKATLDPAMVFVAMLVLYFYGDATSDGPVYQVVFLSDQ